MKLTVKSFAIALWITLMIIANDFTVLRVIKEGYNRVRVCSYINGRIARMMERGQIYFVNLNPVQGKEQSGARPVLILSVDEINMGFK